MQEVPAVNPHAVERGVFAACKGLLKVLPHMGPALLGS